MREIKFRCYSIPYARMYIPITSRIIVQSENNFNDNLKIMQYTGLKDKNGVEIYEGDIVKGVFKHNKNKEIAIVEYGEIDVSNEYDDERVMGYFCGNHCLGSHLELEVKGNIYENPGLLKS